MKQRRVQGLKNSWRILATHMIDPQSLPRSRDGAGNGSDGIRDYDIYRSGHFEGVRVPRMPAIPMGPVSEKNGIFPPGKPSRQ